jgi:heme/copper-type cytochrome/quinol oxidase subunit 2
VSRTQRLAFLGVAAVIAIVAVIALVASGGSDDEEASPTRAQSTATATETAEPEATASETAEPTATPRPLPPLVTTDTITKLRFKQGDTVRFRVRSDIADEVHVHGYDLMKDIKPGQTVTFSFPADITGIFEIELENAGRQIAQLRVDPD